MPPAARFTDQTSHGTPLGPGPGSSNVLIGGLPAWRAIADTHVCPQVTPAGSPHLSGVVTVGSTSVLINNFQAARQGDMITEAGPPNTITMGETTVQIG